jgi:hypothetical protein
MELKSELHRIDGNPAKIYTNGKKEWYVKGKLNRIGGPAVTTNTNEEVW